MGKLYYNTSWGNTRPFRQDPNDFISSNKTIVFVMNANCFMQLQPRCRSIWGVPLHMFFSLWLWKLLVTFILNLMGSCVRQSVTFCHIREPCSQCWQHTYRSGFLLLYNKCKPWLFIGHLLPLGGDHPCTLTRPRWRSYIQMADLSYLIIHQSPITGPMYSHLVVQTLRDPIKNLE